MSSDLEAFERIAKARRTIKVFAEQELPVTQGPHLVERLLACAGWAPFHKACQPEHRQETLGGIEPWRFHWLDAGQCRQLGQRVNGRESAGKIPVMLNAAQSLIIATWLPNPASAGWQSLASQSAVPLKESFEPTLDNVEHIAAASAAVQSLLLAATAAGVESYWSSGGVLRSAEILQLLQIPDNQRFLGAIFLFPTELPENSSAEIATSKLRLQRSSPTAWSRKVQF